MKKSVPSGVFSDKGILRNIQRITKLLWKCSPAFLVLLSIATVLEGLIPAISAYTSKLLIDSIIKSQENSSSILAYVLPILCVITALAFVSLVCSFVHQLLQELMGNLLSNYINELIIEHAIKLDISFYENSHFYDLFQRAKGEAGFRPLSILSQLLGIAVSSLSMVTLLLLLLRFNPIILIILIVTISPAVIVQTHFGQKAFSLLNWRTPDVRRLNYYSQLLTSDASIKEIKLFNLSNLFHERYKKMFSKFYSADKSLAIRRQISDGGLSIFSMLGYYGCYIYIIQQTISKVLTLGDLTLYSSVFLQLQSSLTRLLTEISSIYENTLFIGNLFEFLDLQPLIKEQLSTTPADNATSVPKIWKEGIVFHNVTFCYPYTEKVVLHNVNLKISPGEKIALVGDNGSGNTTIVKLLARFYDPTEGYISLEGKDLREYDIKALQECMGIVFQDYVHYHLSAWENIGLGLVEELDNRERILSAAKTSGVHQVLENLSKGYDSVLGRWFEGGEQLSVGEWQKVALARAFMRNAPLLILDEPTASLDVRAERNIFEKINLLCKDKTAVLISHRFNTVRLADRIFVLEKGRIIEEGNHEKLMDQSGLYANLFKMQAENYEIGDYKVEIHN